MNKNHYSNFLYEKLEHNIEPDPEDYYLAEIESKANKYDKCMLALNKIREYCSKISNLFWIEEDEPRYVSKDILEIINEVEGNEERGSIISK